MTIVRYVLARLVCDLKVLWQKMKSFDGKIAATNIKIEFSSDFGAWASWILG